MPIVFIHGVAVRQQGDPGWEQVNQVTGGVQWPKVRQRLREFVAPAVRPAAPDEVDIRQLYWGDLGVFYAGEGRSLGSWTPTSAGPGPTVPAPADLTPDELGEALEDAFERRSLTRDWPTLLEAVWSVARDENLRSILLMLPAGQQWPFLLAAVEARLPAVPLLARLEEPRPPRRLVVQRRRGLSRTLSTVRRPLEDFVPLFIGDVLAYVGGRGTPERPGPVMARVLAGLKAAQAQARPGEPLVVLTHSMGGQLLYDALTSYLPADPEAEGLRVDLWCATGSQVGLFREMGQFIEQGPLPTPALRDSPHAGYFWNVWSYSDLLSFRCEGVILGAHDTAFPFLGDVRSDHFAYLTHDDFYRTLAVKVRLHARPRS